MALFPALTASPALAQVYPPDLCDDGTEPPCDNANEDTIFIGAETPPGQFVFSDEILLGDLERVYYVRQGGTFRIRSEGWKSNGSVVVQLESNPVRLASFDASATGSLRGSVVIPLTTSLGPHLLRGVGFDPTGPRREVFTHIIVLPVNGEIPGSQSSGGGLPKTGAEILGLATLGLGMVAVGGVLVNRTRNRRSA